jgi:hypothetical protein
LTDIVRRALTDASPEVQEAYRLEQVICLIIGAMRVAWVEIAARLYQFAQIKGWESLGYETFHEWASSPSLGDIGVAHAYSLVETYREFVIERGIPEDELAAVPQSKLKAVLPAVRRGMVPARRALADAETLSRTDLRDAYAGRSRIEGDRPLDPEREPHWRTCEHCGSRYAASS